MKVETDIIASITASPVGQAVILLIMYVETFKTDVFVLNVTLSNLFQYYGQYVNTKNSTWRDQRKNA